MPNRKPGIMRGLLLIALLSLTFLSGCEQQGTPSTYEVSAFVDELKSNGVDGSLKIQLPNNPEIAYVANYVISAYTSTRIISFFKFQSEERAEAGLAEAMQNPKLSGHARNGSLLMAATFYPPDEDAVNRIRELFLAHRFE